MSLRSVERDWEWLQNDIEDCAQFSVVEEARVWCMRDKILYLRRYSSHLHSNGRQTHRVPARETQRQKGPKFLQFFFCENSVQFKPERVDKLHFVTGCELDMQRAWRAHARRVRHLSVAMLP